MSESVSNVVATLAEGARPTPEALEAAFNDLLAGDSSEPLTAAFLMGLRTRGETVEDLVAGARVMRANAASISAPNDVVDTCGTGGLPWTSLNTSTAAAIVTAAAGAVIAKHGNRSAPPKTGSADVVEALGVNLTPSPAQIDQSFKDAGLVFLFAQAHHSAVRHVAPVRKALRVRTIFNLLGPLSNPAGAKRQLLGVYAEEWLDPMANALVQLGAEKAWVVHGVGGLDEISTFGATRIAEVNNGEVRHFTIELADLGVSAANIEDLRGGTVEHNRDSLLAVLAGQASAFADLVVVNAAGALCVSGLATSMTEGMAMARDAIADGRATQCLEALRRASNG